MKNLLLVSLASVGFLALAGCADDTHPQTTTTSSSMTMSSDSKNMTGGTVTTSTPPPPATPTTDTQVNYPAIHSSGQH
jgi:hypothetical protein